MGGVIGCAVMTAGRAKPRAVPVVQAVPGVTYRRNTRLPLDFVTLTVRTLFFLLTFALPDDVLTGLADTRYLPEPKPRRVRDLLITVRNPRGPVTMTRAGTEVGRPAILMRSDLPGCLAVGLTIVTAAVVGPEANNTPVKAIPAAAVVILTLVPSDGFPPSLALNRDQRWSLRCACAGGRTFSVRPPAAPRTPI